MARVLIVDDDPGIRGALSLALRSLGHDCAVAADGLDALAQLAGAHSVDVVILDVMMPGIDGFETCRRIRRQDDVPIVMLTARTDPTDVVVGLEGGADDYVAKPAEPRVLDARIKALLRRSTVSATSPVLRCGDVIVDEGAARITRNGAEVALTPTELKLLIELARHAGQVLSRSQLLDRVWDYGYDGDSRLVDATVQRLRAKLEPDPAQPTYVHTVRGFGYRMAAP